MVSYITGNAGSWWLAVLTLSINPASTTLLQVAGKTFGVPTQLAQRIAVYSDNATKQLQLERQCRAYRQQRRLRSQHLENHSQEVDHVLLNKTAIVLPASPLEGRHILSASTRCSLQVLKCSISTGILLLDTHLLLSCHASLVCKCIPLIMMTPGTLPST